MTRQQIIVQFAAALLTNATTEGYTQSYILNCIGESLETKYVHSVHFPKFVAKQAILYADALLEEMNTAK